MREDPTLYTPFPVYGPIANWKSGFARRALRYPCVLILGPSHAGKTEFALSVFDAALVLEIGLLLFFPEGMRRFQRGKHSAVVCDDVRDLDFLRRQQQVVQGKSMVHEFGSSPTGVSAYVKNLQGVPFILTANFSTSNLALLLEDDFCSRRENVLLMKFPPPTIAAACGLPAFSFPEAFRKMNGDLCDKLDARFNF